LGEFVSALAGSRNHVFEGGPKKIDFFLNYLEPNKLPKLPNSPTKDEPDQRHPYRPGI
jgi:hypothetical protein